MVTESEMIETLAELEHNQWIKWSQEIAGHEKISKKRLNRWKRSWVPYGQLPKSVKDYDRMLALKVWRTIQKLLWPNIGP